MHKETMKKINTKRAFTMAEAILVMSILGVIAAVMIATIKPAEYKQKGYNLLAEKVISELDVATSQVMVNHGSLGYLENFYSGYDINNDTYKQYLATGTKGATCNTSPYNGFKLKDGACVGISKGAAAPATVCAPSSTGNYAPSTSDAVGYISIDVNGDDAPNASCSDRFVIPLTREGIQL